MPKSRVELADDLDTALKKAHAIACIAYETADAGPEEAALWAIRDFLQDAKEAADGIEALRQREGGIR
jgi:hypothetical protein